MNNVPALSLSEVRHIRVAGRVYPFFDAPEASRCYRAAIEALDLGASAMPPCDLLDGGGVVVGHVSYNGRVWAIASRRGAPLLVYDPPR